MFQSVHLYSISFKSLPASSSPLTTSETQGNIFYWLHILIPSLELDMCILTVTSRIKTRVATLDLILGGSKHWALIISLVHIWSDAWRPGTIPLLLIRARTCSSGFTRCYITEQQRSMLTLYSLSPGDDESFIELGT